MGIVQLVQKLDKFEINNTNTGISNEFIIDLIVYLPLFTAFVIMSGAVSCICSKISSTGRLLST